MIGRIGTEGHGDNGSADQGWENGREDRGEDEGVEGVVCEEAEDAFGTGDEQVGLVGGPEFGGVVGEIKSEGFVPEAGVSLDAERGQELGSYQWLLKNGVDAELSFKKRGKGVYHAYIRVIFLRKVMREV